MAQSSVHEPSWMKTLAGLLLDLAMKEDEHGKTVKQIGNMFTIFGS